ncbi:MAG: hypothetical protein FJ144_20730 [Deltaproteobacteria bacterium]|nr:hypothetical protein [Deltaproteobacteria bacterium]
MGAVAAHTVVYACHVATAMPQDAIEPVRRMCRLIVDETCDPEVVPPLWGSWNRRRRTVLLPGWTSRNGSAR